MSCIQTLRVRGVRAISDELVLDGMGEVVVLYGDNAVGKSSVLFALSLLGRVLATPPLDLVRGESAWPFDAATLQFGVEGADFNVRVGSMRIEAVWDSGASACCALAPSSSGMKVVLESVTVPGTANLVAELREVLRALEREQGRLDDAGSGRQALEIIGPRLDSLALERDRLVSLIGAFVASHARICAIPTPVLPVSPEQRQHLAALWHSQDLKRRRLVRGTLHRFSALFPALGGGELEPRAAEGEVTDWAWFTEEGAPDLNRLGGGVQSAFGTLAGLLLAQSAIALIEEPEAFVGERAMDGLRQAIRATVESGACHQVFVATHAVSLGGPGDTLFVLDRAQGATTARRSSHEGLSRFAPTPDIADADTLGRLGVGGGVRLTDRVIDKLGLRPGEFVYFVERDNGGFEIVSSASMAAALSDD